MQIKASVFFTVFRSLKIVGSYVGNHRDAVEAVDLAARGKVTTTIDRVLPLEALPQVYEDMTAQKVVGRIVLNLYVYPSSHGTSAITNDISLQMGTASVIASIAQTSKTETLHFTLPTLWLGYISCSVVNFSFVMFIELVDALYTRIA